MCFGRFLSLRQGGSRLPSESPRCLITDFGPGIGPDQSEWLTLQGNVSVGLIQWNCPLGSVIKPRSRCAPVRARFRTLTSTCRSKSIIVRQRKSFVWNEPYGCREPVPEFLLVTHLSLDNMGYMCPPTGGADLKTRWFIDG